ncbi:hypothetical protein [Alistipes megaguti]|uniref:hypothetical protein n=1 Tax=Alistipes megaguti TaxID=2364787 RepID=UPI002353147E|nr:hypothetical protein [Alistipes megaguti]
MERHATAEAQNLSDRERREPRREFHTLPHQPLGPSEEKTDSDDPKKRSTIRKERSAGRFVVVFLLFGTLVGIALLLLLTALVVWLSQVTGSFIVATLILGGAFALLAAGLYLLTIREAVEQIRARAETVYEVARLARTGYEWLSEKISMLIGIYNLLRKG